MQRIKLILILAALLSSATFAATNQATTYTEDNVSVQASPAQPIFVIKLKSNPTTGYSWFLREYDARFIKPMKHAYQAPQNPKNLMGASGYELWTFSVTPAAFKVPHQTIVRFVYARPWQSLDQAKHLAFRVTTQP